VIVHRCGRVQYDFAVRQAGARLVEIGTDEGATAAEMEGAIGEHTAAILYFYREHHMQRHVPLDQGIEIARRQSVPLIVDAAAQLPPVENLWRFTNMGADLVLFSGGKGLCGPQASGLILGRKDLIAACAFHACPRPFVGRPMKVGKEELVGLLTAVKWYLSLDHDALMDTYEEQVRYVVDALAGQPHTQTRRSFPSEAGQPNPRAEIVFDEAGLGMSRDQVLAQLRAGSPSISLAPAGESGIYVNPQTLKPGQERIIVGRLLEILA
jgi:L-seryl-tRNA(Ser) seleniumtransferase